MKKVGPVMFVLSQHRTRGLGAGLMLSQCGPPWPFIYFRVWTWVFQIQWRG
jgi:hypothetical protein